MRMMRPSRFKKLYADSIVVPPGGYVNRPESLRFAMADPFATQQRAGFFYMTSPGRVTKLSALVTSPLEIELFGIIPSINNVSIYGEDEAGFPIMELGDTVLTPPAFPDETLLTFETGDFITIHIIGDNQNEDPITVIGALEVVYNLDTGN